MFPSPVRSEFEERSSFAQPHQHVGPDDARVPVQGGFTYARTHAGGEPVRPRQSRQPNGGVRRIGQHDRSPADVSPRGGDEGETVAAAQERRTVDQRQRSGA
jgi:hypothetical protein